MDSTASFGFNGQGMCGHRRQNATGPAIRIRQVLTESPTVSRIAVLNHRGPEMARRIRDLQRASYAVEARLIGFDQMPPLVETTSDIAELDLIVLGAVEDEAVSGLLGYRRVGDVVDIDRLAVDPARFRNGIGRALLEELHRREADAGWFEVSTGAANHPAIALYRAVGYQAKREGISRGVRRLLLERRGRA